MEQLNDDVLYLIVSYFDLGTLKTVSLVSSTLYGAALPYLRQSVRITSSNPLDAASIISDAVEFMARVDRAPHIQRVDINIQGPDPDTPLHNTWSASAEHLVNTLLQLPSLHSLRFIVAERGSSIYTPLLNRVALLPALRSFFTNLTNISTFLELHPRLERLAITSLISSHSKPPPLYRLKSLAVPNPSQLGYFIGSPITSLSFRTLGITDAPACQDFLDQSPISVERLSIQLIRSSTLTSSQENIYLDVLSHFDGLRYLNVRHERSSFMAQAEPQAKIFDVLRRLKYLEEVVWRGYILDEVQKAFFERCTPACGALRRVTMETHQRSLDARRRVVYEREERNDVWNVVEDSALNVAEAQPAWYDY